MWMDLGHWRRIGPVINGEKIWQSEKRMEVKLHGQISGHLTAAAAGMKNNNECAGYWVDDELWQ